MRALREMLQSLMALYGFGPRVASRRRSAVHIGHASRRFV
jgi:hypothetical protein